MSAEYQETEIGKFPSSWDIDRVDSAFEIQQGKQVSKKNREGDNQRPFLRTKNVLWNRLELTDLDNMNFTEAEEGRLALVPGDLLTCEGGDIGRTALWNGQIENCYYQNHLHRLRSENGRADPQFAVYWFWYAFNVARLYFGRGNVTTIPNLSRSKLAELPMALPPLAEQKKIARMLEDSVEKDPSLAIGTAKELVETCCKTILAARGKEILGTPDIPTLTKTTLKELKLVPEGVPNAARGADVIKRLLSNLSTVGQGLAELRGLYGTGHGQHGSATGLTARHARLAVGAASTLAVFLFETNEATKRAP